MPFFYTRKTDKGIELVEEHQFDTEINNPIYDRGFREQWEKIEADSLPHAYEVAKELNPKLDGAV